MTEPYILILNALLLSVGNYFIWWLLFDEEFEHRLSTYTEVLELDPDNQDASLRLQGKPRSRGEGLRKVLRWTG